MSLLGWTAGLLLAAPQAAHGVVSFAQPVAEVAPEQLAARLLQPLDPLLRGLPADWLQVDWAAERWHAVVPPECDGTQARTRAGCGLLVWIDPGDDPRFGARGARALARLRLIEVAAVHAGNGHSVERRRIPLALQAALAGCVRWRCDPQRIYVGGFSGGARAAGVAALAWPEVFAGAVLVGGGALPGTPDARGLPLPSQDRLAQAIARQRYALVIGDQDSANRDATRDTVGRLEQLCLHTQTTYTLRRTGHRHLKAAELERTLRWLDQAHPDPAAAQRCQTALLHRRDAAVAAVLRALRTDRAEGMATLRAALQTWGHLLPLQNLLAALSTEANAG